MADFAARTRDPRPRAVLTRLRAPTRVTVRGRMGVGRGAVARALAAAGVPVVPGDAAADAQVVVVAEALKPEDLALLEAPWPAVIVLNKADLAGRVPGGPLAAAAADAARIAAATGLPVVPMIALLACPGVDAQDVAALQTLAGAPADLSSTDAFVRSGHPVPAPVRDRLLARFDRFGIAHAVLACADGADAAAVNRTLRELSQVDRVVAQVTALAAEVAYRRVCVAVDDLHRHAAETRDDALAAFLAGDEAVIAVMAAAVDAMEATGMRVDRGDDPDAHERRAVHWQRYAGGPVTEAHRRCACAIARGSLRLLDRTR
ncbi:hypothetical protein C6A87_001260 [Mycobacterium sp. ITM-2016-00317]|uniref:hypothetical protein n=1 Tax=Mycobacterium sp. ITM-2016-00317 TaxID=2099694 RepID=UPI000D4D5E0D|nr:hypothetical protein [Mycobacterium sp. ITM-2016-00317]WNG87941.1 hypothetical protein C6A87_001260 [Mycobacterium sp. ITM-2016-00317]